MIYEKPHASTVEFLGNAAVIELPIRMLQSMMFQPLMQSFVSHIGTTNTTLKKKKNEAFRMFSISLLNKSKFVWERNSAACISRR